MTEANVPGPADTDPSKEMTGSPAGDELTPEAFESLGREVADLRDKCDKYLRSVAELENIRRRLEREKTEALKYGGEPVIRELLPVLDGLDKAFGAAEGDKAGKDASAFLDGFQMVRKQLMDMLNRQGLEEIKAMGMQFDPHVHQAIQRIETPEVKVDMVHEEYAKGYLLHGRLLRPAIVSVQVPAGS
jgi:molecular chaperone GrpE